MSTAVRRCPPHTASTPGPARRSISPPSPALTAGDGRAYKQRALAVQLEVVGDEPAELRMERRETDVGLGLAVAGDALLPGVTAAGGETARPIAPCQAGFLGGGRGLHASQHEKSDDERGP